MGSLMDFSDDINVAVAESKDVEARIDVALENLNVPLSNGELAHLAALIACDIAIERMESRLNKLNEHRRELINSENLNKNPKFNKYFESKNGL